MASGLAARRRPWRVSRACSGCRGDQGRQAAAPDASWLGSTKVEGCSTIGEPRDSSEPPRTRWWSPIGSMLLRRRSRLVYRTASTACASSGCMNACRYAVQHHCASPHAACACSPPGSSLPIGLATAYTLSAAWQRHLVPISLAARGGVGPHGPSRRTCSATRCMPCCMHMHSTARRMGAWALGLLLRAAQAFGRRVIRERH